MSATTKKPTLAQKNRCRQKTAWGNVYRSLEEVREAALRFSKRVGDPGMRYFRCPSCGLWHIGGRDRE